MKGKKMDPFRMQVLMDVAARVVKMMEQAPGICHLKKWILCWTIYGMGSNRA